MTFVIPEAQILYGAQIFRLWLQGSQGRLLSLFFVMGAITGRGAPLQPAHANDGTHCG